MVIPCKAVQMMWAELISARNMGDNEDREAAVSIVVSANQQASFNHVTENQ